MFNILTALTGLATVGLVIAYVVIAIKPSSALNPYPPTSVSPSPTPSTPPPSPDLSPSPFVNRRETTLTLVPSPPTARSPRLTPTPLRLTPLPPTPTPEFPFDAVVDHQPTSDCDRITLSGTVVNQQGVPLEGYPIHVWGPGVEVIVVSGSAEAPDPSSWEVTITETIDVASATWHIQLHQYDIRRSHPPVSPIINVEISRACHDRGVILVRFMEREE